jgi:hypothetical protein
MTYKEKKSRQMRKRRKKFPHLTLLCLAKQRAKANGLPFNLSAEDIVIPRLCPVLGCRLKHGKDKRPIEQSPTLDRIVPSRGYVKGNVIVISSLANRIKSTANWRQILSVGKWLKRLTV